ncbi:AMP-binding protein [Streptomyces sp. NPDC059649]|uniref:AMP-binding protein n=1 Tax=Streptomyces sp. NPDC059649 TaxID=3346895 RepID=UPI0036AF23BC
MTGPPAPTALAELLDHARRHVPHYQTLIPPGPVSGENAPATLRRLPLLRRTDVRTERPRLWSAEGDARRWRRVHTTGTTGAPLEVVVDEAAQQAELAALIRHVRRRLGASVEPSIMHLTLHLASTSRASVAADPSGVRLVKWNLSRAWQLPDEEFRSAAEALRGQVITVMPSVMAALCDRLGPSSGVAPRLVVLSGEQFTPELRTRIRETFGCPVTALYTLAEAGIVAHECGETGTYHVEESGAFLEVVGEAGEPLPLGVAGDIAVTPLVNRAMPLLRYVNGDRGRWIDGSCGCRRPGPRLQLLDARTQHALLAEPDGRGVRRIDLAKLCRQLDLGVTRVARDGDEIVVEHDDPYPATPLQRTTIAAALRSMLGAGRTVRLRRAEDEASGTARPVADPGRVRPAFLPPADIAAWARDVLHGRPGVLAAVLTGSALDPAAVSRFSDIDVTVVIDGDACQERWYALAAAMNRHLATLRVNVTEPAGPARAPLVACRLLAERHAIVGTLEEAGLTWPAVRELAGEARFWAQNAESVLWTRLTAADRQRTDPVRDAWLASRFCLDALRYRLLCEGARVTAAREVLYHAMELGVPNVPAVRHAFAVGREHRPPPAPGSPEADEFLRVALACVRWLGGTL